MASSIRRLVVCAGLIVGALGVGTPGCGLSPGGRPTTTPASEASSPGPPAASSTVTPVSMPTPLHTASPVAPTRTPTLSPTAVSTATPTPVAGLELLVSDADTGAVLPGVSVVITHTVDGAAVQGLSSEDGILSLPIAAGTYTVQLSLEGYRDYVAVHESGATPSSVKVDLVPHSTVVVVATVANLRTGPSTSYPVVASAGDGDRLEVVGINSAGTWLAVAFEGGTAWLWRDLVGELPASALIPVTVDPPLPDPTPTTAAVVAAAPSAVGSNLLQNPGFEAGAATWTTYAQAAFNAPMPIDIVDAAGEPVSVRSGDYAGRLSGRKFLAFQQVDTATPGATYRLSAWVRLWSGTGVDRTVSQNPEPISAYVCLSKVGSHIADAPHAACSAVAATFDQWVHLSAEVAAETRTLSAILRVVNWDDPHKRFMVGDATWDDVRLVQVQSGQP